MHKIDVFVNLWGGKLNVQREKNETEKRSLAMAFEESSCGVAYYLSRLMHIFRGIRVVDSEWVSEIQ